MEVYSRGLEGLTLALNEREYNQFGKWKSTITAAEFLRVISLKPDNIAISETVAESTSLMSADSEAVRQPTTANECTTFNGSMSSAEDSHAKTSVRPASEQESTPNAQDFGKKCFASFANYDRESSQWRTSQRSFLTEWAEFSETWPRSGMTRNGIAFELPSSERPMSGTECSLLPTPTSTDWKRTPMKRSYAMRSKTHGQMDTLAQWIVRESGLSHARLVPDLWEWIMGFPLMWTALELVETQSFRKSQNGLDGES
jgi:hypothetical protein